MEKPRKTKSKITKKRKFLPKMTVSAPKNLKLDDPNQLLRIEQQIGHRAPKPPAVPKGPKPIIKPQDIKDSGDRFPILRNEELVKRFLNVPMTNNQKGRIRQLLKDTLKGTSDALLPEVINNRIQAILKNPTLTDSDLRKVRILYNMLTTAIKNKNTVQKKEKKSIKNKTGLEKSETPTFVDNLEGNEVIKSTKMEVAKLNNHAVVKHENKKVKSNDIKRIENKPKGPKRYVVFLGNLPLGIDKQKIINHFSEMSDHIKDVRIPKPSEEKKSAIAYVELSNEPAFEFALSKHHSMLGNKRIRVLYTTQKNSKISKTTAKSKSAKLLALQKSGLLLGSTPMNRRRSQRRKKMKEALAKQQK